DLRLLPQHGRRKGAARRGVPGSAKCRKESAMSTNIGGVHSVPRHAGGRRVVAPMWLRILGLLVTLAWALVARGISAAQQAAHIPRVAFLDPGSPTSPAVCLPGFRQGLRDL